VDKSQEGSPNPDQEDESDLLSSSSGSVPLWTDSEVTFLRGSLRGTSLVVALRLRGKFSCVLRKR